MKTHDIPAYHNTSGSFFNFYKPGKKQFRNNMIRNLMILLALATGYASSAQIINVSRSSTTTGWSKLISSAGTISFPSVAAGPSTLVFTIRNAGTAPTTLNLTGSPAVAKSGANAAMFTVVQPLVTTLAAGASTTFTVTYNPSDSLLHTAQLSIANNGGTNPFIINLKGAGKLFFGPQFPPPGAYTYTYTSSGNPGRAGGTTFAFSSVVLSTKTATYWGPGISSPGDLQMQCSLDGSTYVGNENFTLRGCVFAEVESVRALESGADQKQPAQAVAAFRRASASVSPEVVLKTVAAVAGMEAKELQIRRRDARWRAVASRMLCQYGGLTQRAVAAKLGLHTGGAVSCQLRKLTLLLACGIKGVGT